MADSSSIRESSGPVPGLLDPTQPERLLRLPGSRLQFAAFDPLTATARQDHAGLRKLSIKEELCRPRRIIVEIAPSGDSFWRYVPNAHLEDGVEDEGMWPRAINICGEVIQCSQDQWDIYKLDPLYECFVRVHPHLTQITRKASFKTARQNARRKRRASSLSPERSTPVSSRRKRLYKGPESGMAEVNSNTKENMDAVEEMNVDPLPQYNDAMQGAQETHVYKERTEWPSSSHTEQRENFLFNSFQHAIPEETRDVKKRKRPDIPESPLVPDESLRPCPQEQQCSYSQSVKRARTASPTSRSRSGAKRQKKNEKPRGKGKEDTIQEFLAEGQNMNDELIKSFAEATRQMQEPTENNRTESELAQPTEGNEYVRQAAIEESRRKLAELDADKPLWEAVARQRMRREKEEERSIRVKAESLQTEKKEPERKAGILREAEEKKKREEEERLQRKEATRKERERRKRQQQRWAFGPWTTQRALERYKSLSEEFDSTKFSADLPLTMEAVPWPVLAPPARFNVADVDWEAVEKFFARVRDYMKPQEYKTFVEKSHRRFHPDRWRSRSLLKSVLDEAERDGMDVAANTVAQALTPLWRELMGR
ncbi:hypothetical protein AX15_005375 [Amanita polypyramis BW_CC]|nr:hypothetical protein AX15_005375 [Amanita polypyramis BW_CC]